MEGNLAVRLERREQWIDGKVVMMSSPALAHHFISLNIYSIFDRYLRGKPCTPIGDGVDLYLEEGRERYVPDGMVVWDSEKLWRNGVHGTPDLVVEILSPSTARYDLGHKKRTYERYGVREYWIVNPANRSVEQYLLEDGRFILRDVYILYTAEMWEDLSEEERAAVAQSFPCGIFPDLTVRLDDVFYRAASGQW